MKFAKPGNEAITAPILLLVEGKDEAYFLKEMCEHWFPENIAYVDIECVEGGDRFAPAFRALKVRSLGPLRVVGVIADSEEDPNATAQRWRDLFEEVQPVIGRRCQKLQLPSEQTAGAFEALVLQALDGNAVVTCAINFRNCVVPHIGDKTSAQKDKIAVRAWLSASLGRAYANAFKAQQDSPAQPLLDYDHAAFAPIKSFIKSLLYELN